MIDIDHWLAELGLPQYGPAFAENAIDESLLRTLSGDDLKELGVAPLGHRKRILEAIAALPPGAGDTRGLPSSREEPAPSRAGAGNLPGAHEAERRQLTVMFVDLVGSTELSARLDPEDLRAILRGYQNSVTGEIARLGGHVAKLMGDGVLAYFGWPAAYEDAAERAVRAGLAVSRAVSALRTGSGEPLAARTGIATGLVLVGELVGDAEAKEHAVVGETPNLAARLQAVAGAGDVVVAQATQRLIRRIFALEELPPLELRGFDRLQRAWRVTGEGHAEGRFDAMQVDAALPLIGREQELALLLDRWQAARAGEGQVVILSGEPGIGKSRIVMALREQTQTERPTSLRYFCSPQHSGTPFWPFVSQLERAVSAQSTHAGATAFRRLEVLLSQRAPCDNEDLLLIAELMSIAPDAALAKLEVTPEELKARTMGALVRQLEGLARDRPVVLILEDAHWLDPTTRATFDLIVEHVQSLPVLCVVTSRPEFEVEWTRLPHVTLLTLNRLGRAQTQQVIAALTNGRRLPEPLVQEILAKTDGIPLFVEELTKMVLESGRVRPDGDAFVSVGQAKPLAVPDTLRDSLMARLDRFPEAREVAQMAAVVGREFEIGLLAAVADVEELALERALAELVTAGLVLRRGPPARHTYMFKHALIQETAYDSLLRSRRQQLHARTAGAMRVRYAERIAAAPELLAHHLTEAALGEAAVEAWLDAGALALKRCAYTEATRNLERGLEVALSLPLSPQRDRAEMRLRNALGQAMGNSGGPSAAVESSYQRARDLSAAAGDEREWVRASYGLWFFHNWRMEHYAANRSAEELLQRAAQSGDTALVLQAHHAAWTTSWQLGRTESALRHAKIGRSLYDPVQHHAYTTLLGGHDAGVCCRNTLGFARTMMGFVDQGAADVAEGEALARQLGHPFSRAVSLFFRTNIHLLRGEIEETMRHAREMEELSERVGIVVYGRVAKVLAGWCQSAEPEGRADGIAAMHGGLDELKRIGARARRTEYLGLFAERLLAAGDAVGCDAALAEARSLADGTGERFFLAELHRISAMSMIATSASEAGEAERILAMALAMAREQEARLFELRAATELAMLLADRGERQQALDLLAPIHAWFGEGLGTPRLREAQALLDALS